MNPRTIALTIHSLAGGGAERLMSQLANRWAMQGHRIHLITWDDGPDGYPLDARVQRHRLGLVSESANMAAGIMANWRRTRVLRSVLGHIQPDQVLSFCDQMNILVLEAARGTSLPIMIAEHSDPQQQRLSWAWEFLRQRNYRRAKRVVALTPSIAEYMRPWCTGEPSVIPPAIDPPPRPRVDGAGENQAEQKKLLYVGRLSEEKGIRMLLDVWRRVQRELPGWGLNIVGDGPLQPLVSAAASELPRICAGGWSNDVWREYRQSDLFILPSRYEGFPVALLEAMSQGLPCITSRCSSAIEQIAGGLHVCVRRNEREFAEAIIGLASVESDASLLADRGAAIAQDYRWGRIGPMWDELIEAQ